MKCITCSRDIPDTSTVCPYCNNKVEPAMTAGEALGVTNVLPTTPSEYKLPKDQNNVVNTQPVNTTDILPPAPPTLEEETKTEEVVEETKTEDVGTITPPTFDPNSVNLENIDLNANANAQTLDLTK